jgi:aryl-phospho-beta-D-glucosidase BglC (GH1 family)
MAPNPRSVTLADNSATVAFVDTSDWGTGFTGAVTISNLSDSAIGGWTVSFDLEENITNIWNAQIVSHVGTRYVVSNLGWNATIAAGASVSFGFQADAGNPVLPGSAVLNGATLAASSATPTPAPAPTPTPPAPLPTLAIAGATVTEGGAASVNESFTVSLSAAATSPVTVNWSTSDGTAIAGKDYTASSGTLTFAAGTTTAQITVATQQGAAGTHAFTVGLNSPTGATLGTASATGTIIDPALPVISAQNVSATAPTAGASADGSLLPSGFLATKGSQIVDASGNSVRINAVNWFGFESSTFAPHGLDVVNYKATMNQMVQLGFNAIRLPFSLQLFQPGSTPTGINYALNPDLQGLSGLQLMDKIIAYAGQIGLKVILDDHRSAAGNGPNADGLWTDSGYTQAQWLSTWTMLAQHYAGNSTVIGADLSNEPSAATWGDGSSTDWEAAATTAGDDVLAANPNWLVFVEGTEGYQGTYSWAGENLMGVATHPITLSVANRLVYSVHDYPASVYPQPWFSAANYPANLPSVWNQFFGYIVTQNIAPVFVGEFGTQLQTTSDQQWLSSLVTYMDGGDAARGGPSVGAGQQGLSWAYWSWNPDSGDTGGILQNNWTSVNQAKVTAIAPALYNAGTSTAGAVDFTVSLSAASTQPVTIAYATADGTAKAGTDYVATSGTLTFAPGIVSEIVPVQLLSDQAATGAMSFLLDLSSPANATLATTAATATITQPAAATPAPAPTPAPTPTPIPTPTPTATSPTVVGSAALQIGSNWGIGLTATVTVANIGGAASAGWQVEIDSTDLITNVWNGVSISQQGTATIIGNEPYNGQIAGGASTSFGFQATETAGASISVHLVKFG